MAAYLPLLEEELALPRRGPPRPELAQGRRRARRRLPGRRSSAPGMSGLLAAHRLQQAGVAVRRRREERRRRRHVAREHAIRAAGSTTRTTTTATRSRSATTGRCTSRPRTCCSTTSGAAPTTFGLRDHIRFGTEVLSATWSDDDATLDACACATPTAREETLEAERGDQRGRPAQPAVASRHRRARLVRGPGVPLGAVGPRRRPRAASGSR